MIREFDLADSLGIDYGLDNVFVGTNLHVERRYWYAVTPYPIPDMYIIEWPLPSRGIYYDTILTPRLESCIRENMVRVDISYRASDGPGEVKVVPHPYRVDRDYTTEGDGWEGNPATWTDFDRKIRTKGIWTGGWCRKVSDPSRRVRT